MAIDLGHQSVVVMRSERTWRVEIFCELGSVPVVRAHREVITTNEAGELIARDRDIPAAERALTAIADKSVGGVTGLQLAGLVSMWADELRQEDIAAAEQKAGG